MSDELDMGAYRDIFVSESAEYLQGIVEALLKLESDPEDLEPVEQVFRAAHSLKGMAGAMGYERTADLTHKMETLMDTVRRRIQAVDGDLIDLVLRATDMLRVLIDDEMAGRGEVDPELVVQELAERAEASPQERTAVRGAQLAVAGNGTDLVLVSVTLDEACALKSVRAYMVIKRLGQLGEVVETDPSADDIENERFEHRFEALVRTASQPEKVAEAVLDISEVAAATATPVTAQAPTPDRDAAFGRAAKAVPRLSETQTIRIAIGHLDTMVDLVGELVIARSRLETLAARDEDHELRDALEELHRISGELQHEVMATRMVPVANVFNRFPRMVRDLARDLGKDAAFEMSGLEIELDRTVLDEIGDPLVHLLRNAVDHGLEPPSDRTRAGKRERGTIGLRAARERDRVIVTVSDDGRGMDIERIWGKACEHGLASPSQRDEYTDEDILLFTCTAGFSTADEATQVSGRGVGMDVVRGRVEQLGGSLTIRSRPGEGTEFVLSLPLTVAIIQSLLVSSGGQVYAVPLGAVGEVFAHGELPVDTVEGAPVLTMRDGRVVPLLRLGALLGVSGDATSPPRPGEHIVLMESGEDARGLVVDALVGRQEIVIKPLASVFRGIRGLGGATVLGDGSVALILDPRQMFSMGDGDR